jgi:glycine betaine/proline transport system substrate-binding protein
LPYAFLLQISRFRSGHLQQEYVQGTARPLLLYEVGKRISNREEFAFIAWSPHWMNQRYDFVYLDDPEDALGELNDPSKITTVIRERLPNDDAVAYALIKALTLTEEEVGGLEEAINAAGDPLLGARTWAKNYRDVVQPWIDAAK